MVVLAHEAPRSWCAACKARGKQCGSKLEPGHQQLTWKQRMQLRMRTNQDFTKQQTQGSAVSIRSLFTDTMCWELEESKLPY